MFTSTVSLQDASAQVTEEIRCRYILEQNNTKETHVNLQWQC
jgi:hypothetical protein